MDKKRVLGLVFIAIAVIYGVSPVDLAPELVLGPVGLVDDAAVVAAAIGVAVKLFSSKNGTQSPSE